MRLIDFANSRMVAVIERRPLTQVRVGPTVCQREVMAIDPGAGSGTVRRRPIQEASPGFLDVDALGVGERVFLAAGPGVYSPVESVIFQLGLFQVKICDLGNVGLAVGAEIEVVDSGGEVEGERWKALWCARAVG